MTKLFDKLELKYSAIAKMWQTAEIYKVSVVNNLYITLAIFRPQSKRISGVVLITPGRGEIMTKYGELIHDLLNRGAVVAIYDHRGQGFSSSLLLDKRIGYVDNFEDYTRDLEAVLCFLRNQKRFKYISVVAHSMGAAITLDYLLKYDASYISKVLLVSPMLKLPLTPLSSNLLSFLSRLKQFKWMFSILTSALPGRGRDKKTVFEGNPYSHDFERFTYFRAIYPNTDSLSTAGVSLSWLLEALRVTKELNLQASCFNIPVSIVTSGADIIVDNKLVADFCAELHKVNHLSPSEPLVIEKAYHELHLESDEFRDIFLEGIYRWLDSDLIMTDKDFTDEFGAHQTKEANEVSQNEPKGLYKYYPMKFVYQWKEFLRNLSQLS